MGTLARTELKRVTVWGWALRQPRTIENHENEFYLAIAFDGKHCIPVK